MVFFFGFLFSCKLATTDFHVDEKKPIKVKNFEAALPDSVKLYTSYIEEGKAVQTPLVSMQLSDGSAIKIYSATKFINDKYKNEYYGDLKKILLDHGIDPQELPDENLKKYVEYADHYILPGGIGATVECRWEWAFFPFTSYRKLFFQFDDSHKFSRLRMTHRRTSTAFHIFVDGNSTAYDKSWGAGQSSVDAHCHWRAAWDNPWWDYDIKVWYKVGNTSYFKELYHRK